MIDLSSLTGEHAKGIVALAALRAVWEQSRNEWYRRHHTVEGPSRTPTFLVVDEAQHLCGVDPPRSPIAAGVKEALLQVASEGRKYGIWLICGTQRPLRLHPTIASESANLLVMKTTSPEDGELLVKQLGLPDGPAQLASLKLGEGYLGGAWAGGKPTPVKVGRRFTQHPEGGFEPEEWVHGISRSSTASRRGRR